MKKHLKTLLLTLIIGVQTGLTIAQQDNKNVLSFDEAKAKGEDFINKVMMGGGGKAIIKGVSDEGCLFKLVVEINAHEYTSYMSKDGKTFYQTGSDIDSEMAKYIDAHTALKSAKPAVELFVMSYCPYGIQIEKGLLPVLATLGNKIDFELKFCSYAMHERTELVEQLRQYCIQKQSPTKLTDYLRCFLEAGKSGECLIKAAIDTVELNNCIAETDNKYKVLEKYNDKESWKKNRYPYFDIYKEENSRYDLKGSPNLIINGKRMASAWDSESLLELICSSFNDPPEECKLKLSSANPAPGFGYNTTEGPTQNNECNGNVK